MLFLQDKILLVGIALIVSMHCKDQSSISEEVLKN